MATIRDLSRSFLDLSPPEKEQLLLSIRQSRRTPKKKLKVKKATTKRAPKKKMDLKTLFKTMTPAQQAEFLETIGG